jgi:hypothetical protein
MNLLAEKGVFRFAVLPKWRELADGPMNAAPRRKSPFFPDSCAEVRRDGFVPRKPGASVSQG